MFVVTVSQGSSLGQVLASVFTGGFQTIASTA